MSSDDVDENVATKENKQESTHDRLLDFIVEMLRNDLGNDRLHAYFAKFVDLDIAAKSAQIRTQEIQEAAKIIVPIVEKAIPLLDKFLPFAEKVSSNALFTKVLTSLISKEHTAMMQSFAQECKQKPDISDSHVERDVSTERNDTLTLYMSNNTYAIGKPGEATFCPFNRCLVLPHGITRIQFVSIPAWPLSE